MSEPTLQAQIIANAYEALFETEAPANVISSPAGYTAQFFSNSWASRSYLASIPSQP